MGCFRGVPTIVDFNKHYQRCREDCGEPFMEVVNFFRSARRITRHGPVVYRRRDHRIQADHGAA